MATTLRTIHRCMTERQPVVLADGRTGRIVKVDTVFPANRTTVLVWTAEPRPAVAKVALASVVGPAKRCA
jgi:hypothetical protein